MVAIRCTAKLLQRLKIRNPEEPSLPENALGDWFANIIYTRRKNYVAFVSERSFLPLFTTARDLKNLVPRFLKSLEDVLAALDVSRALVEREVSRTEPIVFGRTNSRTVLGSMNDFVFLFRYMTGDEEIPLLEMSLRLGRTPCGPIKMETPIMRTIELLRNPHGFEVMNGGQS